MQKLITILVAFSLTFAAGALAAKPEGKGGGKKQKNAAKQAAAPKQHQAKAPKTEVHTGRAKKDDAGPKVSKKQIQQAPDVSNARRPDKPNKIEKEQLKAEKKEEKRQAKQTRLSQERVATIQAQHRNFQARPSTAIASVRYNPDYRIQAAQSWNGAQYEVFRSYQPQWHDQSWYRSRYSTNVLLIGGGWYFWDSGYWYPAWGYDESAAYYPYDGPIYSGPSARPFDQVVADVQAALQEQGYYRGEVDGLLGPLTREALAEYQQSAGLYTTQTIDQPTLEALGLS